MPVAIPLIFAYVASPSMVSMLSGMSNPAKFRTLEEYELGLDLHLQHRRLMTRKLRFSIDRGGTFTDVFAEASSPACDVLLITYCAPLMHAACIADP